MHTKTMHRGIFGFIAGVAIITVFFLLPAPGKAETCPVDMLKPYKLANERGVYYVDETCQKRPIKNSQIYFSHFTGWSDVKVWTKAEQDAVSDHPLGFIPWGPKRTFDSMSLIKTVDDARVYLVIGEKRYPIESEDAFHAVAFQWNWIEDVTPAVMEKFKIEHTVTGVETLPVGSAVIYDDAPTVYVVETKSAGGTSASTSPSAETVITQVAVPNEAAFTDDHYRIDRIPTLSRKEQFEKVSIRAIEASTAHANEPAPNTSESTAPSVPNTGATTTIRTTTSTPTTTPTTTTNVNTNQSSNTTVNTNTNTNINTNTNTNNTTNTNANSGTTTTTTPITPTTTDTTTAPNEPSACENFTAGDGTYSMCYSSHLTHSAGFVVSLRNLDSTNARFNVRWIDGFGFTRDQLTDVPVSTRKRVLPFRVGSVVTDFGIYVTFNGMQGEKAGYKIETYPTASLTDICADGGSYGNGDYNVCIGHTFIHSDTNTQVTLISANDSNTTLTLVHGGNSQNVTISAGGTTNIVFDDLSSISLDLSYQEALPRSFERPSGVTSAAIHLKTFPR